MVVLQIEKLQVEYQLGWGSVRAVNGVDLVLHECETMGLVGESGCGKSTLAKAILRLLPPAGRIIQGKIILNGVDVLALDEEDMRRVRWKDVSIIPQYAFNALNPVLRVGNRMLKSSVGTREFIGKQRGHIVEEGPTEEVIHRPMHPYTMALIGAAPTIERGIGGELAILAQDRNDFTDPACRFYTRCPMAFEACKTVEPTLEPSGDERHKVRCHLFGPLYKGQDLKHEERR